jgi:branched-chain amino acid transport system permease protein
MKESSSGWLNSEAPESLFMWQQLLINGLAMGCIYALIALSLVMIYKSVGIINFAHGELVMLGAYGGVTTAHFLGLSLSLSFLTTLVAMGIFGFLFQLGVYKPLQDKPFLTILMSTLGISIALQHLAMLIWSPYPHIIKPFWGSTPIRTMGIHILPQNILIFITTSVVLLLLYILFAKTNLGWMMLATAQDRETARLVGIRVNRLTALTFIIASAVAATAGFLVAPLFVVTTDVGFAAMLKAFASTIVGGFGSLPGAVLGGFFVGLVETFVAGYVSTAYKDVVAFLIIIFVLLFFPQGFLGEKIQEKV